MKHSIAWHVLSRTEVGEKMKKFHTKKINKNPSRLRSLLKRYNKEQLASRTGKIVGRMILRADKGLYYRLRDADANQA